MSGVLTPATLGDSAPCSRADCAGNADGIEAERSEDRIGLGV